jgi:hypothetical protein
VRGGGVREQEKLNTAFGIAVYFIFFVYVNRCVSEMLQLKIDVYI